MIATVIKIHPKKVGRNEDIYQRVEFKTPEGWAKTDLVPSYANYFRWISFLKEGIVLEGLKKKGNFIDADSHPYEP
jgi:hypothetical protein